MKLELAKELFRDSWSRRDQLTGSIATPITVWTGVGGIVVVLTANFPFHSGLRTAFFVTFLAISAINLVAAAVFIARSYHGYTYQEIPNAIELDKYCEALHNYHNEVGGKAQDADKEFDEYLAQKFVEAADANSRNNVSKAAYLYRASQFLICAIAALALSAVPWSIGRMGHAAAPNLIAITNPVRVQITTEDQSAQKSKPTNSATTTATATSAAGAPKPSDQRGRTAPPSSRPASPTSARPPKVMANE